MAPLASDPRLLLVVFNGARRKALYTLIDEIASYMRAQLELPQPDSPPRDGARPTRPGDAPLFAPAGIPDDASTCSSEATSTSTPDASVSQRVTPPGPELVRLRRSALVHFDAWRKELLAKLKEILAAPDDQKIVDERRKRTERVAAARVQRPAAGEDLIDFGFGGGEAGKGKAAAAEETAAAVATLQGLYHPIPTRLTTVPSEDRKEALSAVLLVMLSAGNYSADSRALAVYLTSALGLPLSVLVHEETEIARSLVEASTSEAAQQHQQAAAATMSADAEALKRKQDNQSSRYWKVGLASVAGAALIGVTGGLAAPVVAGAIGGLMGTVGLGGVASFLGIFWMNGALVGTLFGAFGARMTGEMVDQYAREVEDFRFLPLTDEWGREYKKEDKEVRRLRVIIGINGWLTSKEDVTKPWRFLGNDSEVFALRYEMEKLLALGKSLEGLVSSYAWSVVKVEILKRTVLATLWSALWPAYLLNAASYIDNPFSLARNRSEKAGKVLADALINKVQGERPVTLIGYSLGARVIYSCLRSLAARQKFGLIENVIFVGAPIPSNRNHWQMMRSVVSGKMYNVYSDSDYILAFLYRATSIQLGIAGLQAINDIEGVENLDLSQEVQGHLRYPDLIGKILVRCGFTNIKGADGPIEKENNEIALQDSDGSKAGTLIDFGDLAIADPAKPKPSMGEGSRAVTATPTPSSFGTPTPRSSGPKRPMQTTMARSKPQALDAGFDPLGAAPPPPAQKPSPPPPYREPQTSAPAGGEAKFVLESENTKYGGSVRDFAIKPPVAAQSSAPAYSSSSSSSSRAVVDAKPKSPEVPAPQARHEVQEDSSDEDDYGGIKMEDNDDFDYVEPIPIED